MSMSKAFSKSTAFTRNLVWLGILFPIAVIAFWFYVLAEKEIDHAHTLRHRSYLIAEELHQSSDELTRMARTYVVTGNLNFKHYYHDILDIRDGKLPRPEKYSPTYWDLVISDASIHQRNGSRKASLLELMHQAGFTQTELEKLSEAKRQSDELTAIDIQAMNLMEATGHVSELDRAKARQMLHDANYHRSKAEIVGLISVFHQMLDRRTVEAVSAAESNATWLRWIFVLIGLTIFWRLWLTGKALRDELGGSVGAVKEHIMRIGKGDLSQSITIGKADGESVLGWLSQMQDRIKILLQERESAAAKLQRISNLYAALSQCNQSIVRCKSEAELFPQICRDVVEYGGMAMAWIGRLDDASKLIKPVASFGAGVECLDGIEISIDANSPNGQGTTATALRENRPCWCQDFQHAAATIAWHERGAKCGWGAAAALPILCKGKVVGAFSLYASEVGAFDEAVRNLLQEMAMDISYALDRFSDDADKAHYLSELKHQQALAKMAGELAKIGAWAVELPQMRVIWSDEVCDIHEVPIGTQPTLVEGINYYAPEYLDRIQQVVGDCIEHGIPYDEELQIITAKGKRIWVRAIGIAERDEQGSINRIQGAFQDISELKRIEAELHANDVRYQQLFQSLITGFALHEIICNDDGEPVDYRFIEINPAFERLTGLLGSQVIGRTVLEVIPGLEKLWIERYGHVALTGETIAFEYPVPELGKYFDVVAYSPKQNQFVTLFNDVTQRKAAEIALQESEAHQRNLLQNLHSAILVHGPDTRILFSNPYASRMLGLSTEQMSGKQAIDPAWHFVNEHGVALTLDQYPVNRVLNTHQPIEDVVIGVSVPGRGETTWGLLAAFPEFDANGSLNQIVVNFHDITSLKKAEREVVESAEIFQKTFNLASVGIARVAPDGAWLEVNQRICDIVGYSKKELLKLTFQDITHPDDLSIDMGYVQKLLAGSIHNYSMEKRYIHKGGHIIWVNLSVALVRDVEGDPRFFISIIEDISLRKKAESQLLKLSLAVDQSPNSIVITDLDANIEYANSTFAKVTGYSLEEAVGKNPRMLQSGRTPKATYDDMWAHLSAGAVWSGELINRTKDGIEYIESALISPVRQSNGEITNYLAIKQNITEKRRDEEQIQHLAHYDHLTGLPNRSLLNERFSYALSLAQRSNEPLAVMFLDLDHFKNINDTLGHSLGDLFLIEVAKRLKLTLREEDTVSRLGGDEFILVLPGTDADAAAIVASKLINVVSQPYQIESHELIGTPSIGIAIYPEDGDNLEDLLKNADTAMYRVKQESRNNFRFFTAEMQSHSERNLQLVNAMRHALERNEFHLQYQPQITLRDGHIVGAEALLRWQHPELGTITPAEFIPIAEDSGQIILIGEWVLRTAVKQMRDWLDSGLPPMVIAVNLSAIQFRQTNLPDLVTRILEEAQLPAEYLELELTEAVAMDDPQSAISVMDDLSQRGIRMSIDDFGTGYSSLSYLKRFKVYKLKIDQSFVRDISDDPEDKAIVTAIISLANSLGMHTIAEGVETANQLAFLRLQGCDEVQGYYFSKPLKASEFELFVRNS